MDDADFSLPWPDAVHPEQFPGTIARDAVLAGHRHADLDKPFTYCELGCGSGATLLTLAASFPSSSFYGIDDDAVRIAHVRDEADASGLDNVTLFEGSFESTHDIPHCDFVSAHGILSLLPEGSAAILMDAAFGLLKQDGLLQLQANLLPGWAQIAPLRQIIRHAASKTRGDAVFRAQSACLAAKRLCESDEPFAEMNPSARQTVEAWRGKELAHVARHMLGPHVRYFSIGEILTLAAAHGFECCGPLHHNRPHGRAYLEAEFPDCDVPSACEDFISLAKMEFHRSLVFRKPGPGSAEIGDYRLMGSDIVGFPMPARWSDETNQDFSALTDTVQELDELPLWLGSIAAHTFADDSLHEDLDLLGKIVGEALTRRRAVIYASMTVEFELKESLRAYHPLTTRRLDAPRTYRYGTHLPSPILGGGVAVDPAIAALLRAKLSNADDVVDAAREAIAEMDALAPPWALPNPERSLPDPEPVLQTFEQDWLPFLGRLRVIEPLEP